MHNKRASPFTYLFFSEKKSVLPSSIHITNTSNHGLWTPREKIAFTARPKIQSQSQIFRYGRSIFCLPHRPNFSDIFDLLPHWLSVVRASNSNGRGWKIKNSLFIRASSFIRHLRVPQLKVICYHMGRYWWKLLHLQ